MENGFRPELLAPAGNWECANAAVTSGADAIYFGLPRFNARLRADNFTEEDLPQLMEFLHEQGVRGYVTMNTLIFTSELADAERQLRLLEEAHVDAIIVQDLGLVQMARKLAPSLDIHASTQMTITSPEGLSLVHDTLGLDLAVLARENSLREMRLFKAKEPGAVPLETFVHGALCVAYSGQCLTSEALGQRSANRGECAQACRLPYELVVDGETKDLGDKRYLLSPQDLAAVDQIPDLIDAGIHSFKIEGRLKAPEYVTAVTSVYRKAIDAAIDQNEKDAITEEDRYAMEMTFSRGFYSGWVNGVNHQELCHGRFGKKRGPFVGRILNVGPDFITIQPECPLKNGDGIVFDTGGDTNKEQGGRIFSIREHNDIATLTFQRGKIQFDTLKEGDRVWKTDDPALAKKLRQLASRVPELNQGEIHFTVRGAENQPLELSGHGITLQSKIPLVIAEKRPLDDTLLNKQLGRLGNTGYSLGSVTNELPDNLILPVSELNDLRRKFVSAMDARDPETIAKPTPAPGSYKDLLPAQETGEADSANLTLLCRTMEQIEAALSNDITDLLVDFEDVRRYKDAVDAVRAQGKARIFLATPRIQKAGEQGYFKLIERTNPDGVLIRNLGAVAYYKENSQHLAKRGDFSLNISNPITAKFFREQGLNELTISYDLNVDQIIALLDQAPSSWFELTLHQHLPMFHMEHCVFCAFMSKGTDYTNCGRPCEKHEVQLRDRVGMLHPLAADVGCRNTLFHGQAQSGADYYQTLFRRGLRNFRIELLKENATETANVIQSYRRMMDGTSDANRLFSEIQAQKQLGVTQGTMKVKD